MERILEVPARSLEAWRASELYGWSDAVALRIERLEVLHMWIWMAMPTGNFAGFWRGEWRDDTVLEGRSPLGAVLADGSSALDLIENHCRGGALS